MLDYSANAAALGKNVGDDLAEGKPTLPLLHAMRHGNPQQASLIREAIEQGGKRDAIDEVLAIMAEHKFQKPRKQKVRKDPNAPFIREKLELPEGHNKLLLHSCCAPCSGEVMEAILASGIEFTIYFYNPNIHPLKEYLIRKEENIRFAQKFGIPFIDADYDRQQWFDRAKGMEWEPERGIRCTMCFDMRFEKAAEYAHEHGFPVFTSCLGISRWKDMDQINGCGHRAAEKYDDVIYWDYNWRKAGGSQRMIEISKRERFYQQEYCGCVYSLRDSNKWREETGRQKIEIGKLYYTPD